MNIEEWVSIQEADCCSALCCHGILERSVAEDLGLVEDAEGLADDSKHPDVRTSLDLGSG